jgi:RNA polymerase sigma-70 factor (ECF subfamily)
MHKNYFDNKILVAYLKKGDEGAYAYLWDAYHHKLCVYAKSLSRDIYIAEDIVQTIFLRVWEQRRKLKDIYPIKSYLYQSVYNEYINQYRKKSTFMALEKEYVKNLNTITEEDPRDFVKWITLINQEIQNLPPKCKKIFLLGKREGLTYIEISEHLNISFRTVENQMSKAFSIIREKVDTIQNNN